MGQIDTNCRWSGHTWFRQFAPLSKNNLSYFASWNITLPFFNVQALLSRCDSLWDCSYHLILFLGWSKMCVKSRDMEFFFFKCCLLLEVVKIAWLGSVETDKQVAKDAILICRCLVSGWQYLPKFIAPNNGRRLRNKWTSDRMLSDKSFVFFFF